MALRRFDEMLTSRLDLEMKKNGLKVIKGVNPKAVYKNETSGLMSLELDNGELHKDFDLILIAIGRSPISKQSRLEVAGVHTDFRGRVLVDNYQNTNVKNIYALGDCVGNVELTPMAVAAGRRLADRLFGGMEYSKANYDLVPTVVFSHPPIATIGLTEALAREKFAMEKLKIYRSKFINSFFGPRKVAHEEKPQSHLKVICVGDEEMVVGLHMIGMGSDEILQGFAVAMKMGCTKADLDNCIAIHPTAAEEFVTLQPWGLSKTR